MQTLRLGLVIFFAAISCSDDKPDNKPSPPPPTLAKDPTSIPAEEPKHCLPLPKGWPNPWPCLPSQPKLEPMPASALGEAINKERAAKGLSTLAEDKRLACAASKHASELVLRKTCVHTGTDGSSFVERLTKCGFTVNGGSEVIACGHASPQAAVEALMKSPVHRAILTQKSLERLGAAVSNNYYVVVFAPN